MASCDAAIILQRGRNFDMPITRYTDKTKTVIDPYTGSYEAELRSYPSSILGTLLGTFTCTVDGFGSIILFMDETDTITIPTNIATAWFDVKTVGGDTVCPPVQLDVRDAVTE